MAVQERFFSTFVNTDPTKAVVTTGERFERLIKFLETRKELTFDYETSGLNWFQNAEAVGIGFGAWDDQGQLWNAYVPFRHRTGEAQLDIDKIGPAIGRLLGNPNTLKIAHNIKFEDHFSRREGWTVAGPRFDTMIAARLYDENAFIALENRAAKDLGYGDAAYDGKNILNDVIKKLAKHNKMKITEYKSRFGYSEVPIGICGFYACHDTQFTSELHAFYRRWGMAENYSRIWSTEMELTRVLCDMEQTGMPVDVEYLEQLRQQVGQDKLRIEAELSHTHSVNFNVGSDIQIRRYMQDHLGLRWDKKTKAKLPSVDSEVLEYFADQYGAIRLLLDWRDADKIETTYTTSILGKLDSNNYVHGSLQQVGTVTGRLSCKDPNYQNFPAGPRVRTAFLVPQDRTRVFLDYSQVELRVLAYYSHDPIMVDNYLQGGDIHERTSQEMAQLIGREFPRRISKVINFGLSYGMTEKGFSRNAKIPVEEARYFLNTFFERYKGIPSYTKELCAQARRQGCQWSNIFGRTRRIPALMDDEFWRAKQAERQMIASAIQGTAAELTKESLVRMDRYFKERGLPAQFVNTVHDEIQLDVDRSCLDEVVRASKQMMEDYPEFHPIPIIVDAEVSETNWAEKQAYQRIAA